MAGRVHVARGHEFFHEAGEALHFVPTNALILNWNKVW
jgi:hypothetical protein